jgi:ribonuclease HI
MKLLIHIDGGARGNPGPAGVGVVIESEDPAFVVHEAGYYLGVATNNVAEYQGLIRGLELAAQLKPREIVIHSDSQLMVKQITGEYRVKDAKLKALYERAQSLLLKFDLWRVGHVYREDNRRADELANMAMDQKRDVIVTDGKDFVAAGSTKSTAASIGSARTAAPKRPVAPKPDDGPRWSVAFASDPGSMCPARCVAGAAYRFGPGTPAGFCIFAAQAVFEDGPIDWSRNHPGHDEAKCIRCGVELLIQKLAGHDD